VFVFCLLCVCVCYFSFWCYLPLSTYWKSWREIICYKLQTLFPVHKGNINICNLFYNKHLLIIFQSEDDIIMSKYIVQKYLIVGNYSW